MRILERLVLRSSNQHARGSYLGFLSINIEQSQSRSKLLDPGQYYTVVSSPGIFPLTNPINFWRDTGTAVIE
jgi:hypothetical protein